jgi:transcriptional regulator with XRE-family HTH domain
MNDLNNQEKIILIKNICTENYISAFEISQNSEISDVGVSNILKGKSKNPRTKTLDQILIFLEKRITGTKEKKAYLYDNKDSFIENNFKTINNKLNTLAESANIMHNIIRDIKTIQQKQNNAFNILNATIKKSTKLENP